MFENRGPKLRLETPENGDASPRLVYTRGGTVFVSLDEFDIRPGKEGRVDNGFVVIEAKNLPDNAWEVRIALANDEPFLGDGPCKSVTLTYTILHPNGLLPGITPPSSPWKDPLARYSGFTCEPAGELEEVGSASVPV